MLDFSFIYVIINMSFINSLSTSSNGAPGIQGLPGTPGTQGNDGDDGERGADGIDGAVGADGIDGAVGAAGIDGAAGAAGNDGAAGVRGYRGYTGDTGATGSAGTNAGPNPSFDYCTVKYDLRCGRSLINNGYKTLRTVEIYIDQNLRSIEEIGRKFTGIVVISAIGNDLSSAVFAVSNNSNSVNGEWHLLSVQGDYYDGNKQVRLTYQSGELKVYKNGTKSTQRYAVSYFGYHS
jgi:hypothetical protein